VEAALGDVREGLPLIAGTVREAMLEEPRSHRAHPAQRLVAVEPLTRREWVVLVFVIDGLSAEEVAETRYAAPRTVR
jgi:DNA-binding NarL/FixJ family response regulator